MKDKEKRRHSLSAAYSRVLTIETMEDPDDLYYDDMDSIVRGLEGTTLLYRENNNCQEEM